MISSKLRYVWRICCSPNKGWFQFDCCECSHFSFFFCILMQHPYSSTLYLFLSETTCSCLYFFALYNYQSYPPPPPSHTHTHTYFKDNALLFFPAVSHYPAVYIFVLLSLSSSIFLVPRTSFSYYSCVPGLFFTSSSLACSRLSPTLCGSYAWHLPQPFDMLHFILWVSHVTLLGFVCACDCFPQKVRVKQREKRMNKEEEFTHLARVC